MKNTNHDNHQHGNQFVLMNQKRFAPFFWTQFLGAANDNVFKFALTVMLTYQLQLAWLPPEQVGIWIGALFVLPFVLLSATSGQLADHFDKKRVMIWVKNLEIAVMGLALVGFFWKNVPILLLCVVLMGVHSTLFGPVKFAHLPQVLCPEELTGGNGMVEMGTFVAILLGQLAGGLLVMLPNVGPILVGVCCLVLASLGRFFVHHIPPVVNDAVSNKKSTTTKKNIINWNPVSETLRNLRVAKQNRPVFYALLGISWMWFFGAVFLGQFSSFAKVVLHGNEHVASLLLVVFSIGIAVGSLLCEALSKHVAGITLVPLGALGMSVFVIDMYFATHSLSSVLTLTPTTTTTLQGIVAFVHQPHSVRILFDLFVLSLSAGLYSVPLYAWVQLNSASTHLARTMAANNILNALFMVASSVLTGIVLALGFGIVDVFLLVGLLNIVVLLLICKSLPEYVLRCFALFFSHCMYRFNIQNAERIPQKGAVILVCNHVSFVDALLIFAASRRPVRFVMDDRIYNTPQLAWLFKAVKAIPIAPKAENTQAFELAFQRATEVLRVEEVLCIFPEGFVTFNGKTQAFKKGVNKIMAQATAQGVVFSVVPMALGNLWGSFFSRIESKGAMTRPFRRGMRSRVVLNVGLPMAGVPSAEDLKVQVVALLEQQPTIGNQ